MSDHLPSVTVLIPTRPEQADIPAVTAARALDYPPEKLEILVVRGKQPSVQRNAGLKAAGGELIYFLDDDSLVRPGNLRRAARHFCEPAVMMAGGPNVCPHNAPELEQVFAFVLGSWLAFGPSRARYARIGVVRVSSEKELILCNLIARRGALLELGGFDEALYPNEENALMDKLQKRGGQLIYDPELIVHRRPRSSIKAFFRMLMTYGRGRAEQFRQTPTLGSALNFAPPLFLVYLIVCAPLAIYWRQRALVPLALYGLLIGMETLTRMPSGGVTRSLLAAPLIPLTHVLYGFGFWRGLFTRLKAPGERPDTPVQIERIGYT